MGANVGQTAVWMFLLFYAIYHHDGFRFYHFTAGRNPLYWLLDLCLGDRDQLFPAYFYSDACWSVWAADFDTDSKARIFNDWLDDCVPACDACYWLVLKIAFVFSKTTAILGFLLPLYAFWHFDDFSWGKTRNIEEEVDEFSEQTVSFKRV